MVSNMGLVDSSASHVKDVDVILTLLEAEWIDYGPPSRFCLYPSDQEDVSHAHERHNDAWGFPQSGPPVVTEGDLRDRCVAHVDWQSDRPRLEKFIVMEAGLLAGGGQIRGLPPWWSNHIDLKSTPSLSRKGVAAPIGCLFPGPASPYLLLPRAVIVHYS